jgi:hypothetical protein
MIKNSLIFLIVIGLVFVYYRQTHKDYYDYLTMSGATPLAVARRVPSNTRLTIDGLVKKEYRFTGDALNALATTRIRTREISPAGDFMGAYIHVGIPVFNILEGIAPQKNKDARFDHPLDILVTFHSASGEKARFSFNELIMTGDCQPVTLAFSRQPVMPTNEKVRDTYTGNPFMDELTGLRLICPKEKNTSRYLDNVVRISYDPIPVDENTLPPRRKKFACYSASIACMDGSHRWPGELATIDRANHSDWIRIGHGHGYDEIARAEGAHLRGFLTANFDGAGPDDFFLFVACDGYRALFSAREIFTTPDGEAMLIVDRLNGKAPAEGLMLAPTADYFSDRAMWGLAHVVHIPKDRIDANETSHY